MPFGFCNVPATFEHLMNTALIDLIWKICVYLNDVIIYEKIFEEKIINLKRKLSANLFMTSKKCTFFRKVYIKYYI